MRAFGIAMAAGLLASLTTFGISQAVGSNAPVSLSSAVAADTGQIRACANRETGDLRLLSSGKCSKGERLVVWSQEGPQGPPGAGMYVVDGNGQRVPGASVDLFSYNTSAFRILDGLVWQFQIPSGELKTAGLEPAIYLGTSCLGQAYGAYTSYAGPRWQVPYIGLAGKAYRLNDSASPLSPKAGDLVVLGDESGCSSPREAGEVGGLEYLLPLVPVKSPPDLVGPLRIVGTQ